MISKVLAKETNFSENENNNSDGYRVSVNPGDSVTCYVGNRRINPELTIAKYNDLWPVDQTAGAVINFTLTIEASENAVKNVRVVDLMPQGFSFNGIWSVVKNGSEDITASVSNPNYASPGQWQLGDMNEGDKIVISFPATINSNQDPGLYKDLAYAYGCAYGNTCEITDEDGVVLAKSIDSGKADTGVITNEFVGTQVNLVKDLQTDKGYKVEKEKIGEVLGASTGLPGTGANGWLTIVLWLMLTGSLTSLLVLFRKKIGRVILTVFLSFFLLAGSAQAATDNLTVRLEHPKSPTNNNVFNITYTTLDLQDRAITAKCYKKGPTDGSYSQFGATGSFTAGGSGICKVDPTVMNNSGTYLFKVEAVAGADSKSEVVTVDFGSSSLPETPIEYNKDKIESCKYRIKGKSANDGKTVKVELYRSDSLSFTADAGTKIHTFTVGPNTSFELENSVPHCDRDYYYALRAFDQYGNGSDLIGDRNIKVITTTTIAGTEAESGALPVEGGAGIAEEVITTQGQTEAEKMQEKITGTAASDEKSQTETTPEEGQVLGVKTAKTVWEKLVNFAKQNPLLSVIIVLGIGIILYVTAKAVKVKQQSS